MLVEYTREKSVALRAYGNGRGYIQLCVPMACVGSAKISSVAQFLTSRSSGSRVRQARTD